MAVKLLRTGTYYSRQAIKRYMDLSWEVAKSSMIPVTCKSSVSPQTIDIVPGGSNLSHVIPSCGSGKALG